MNDDRSLREALDLIVPPSDEVNEWADVLHRAQATPSTSQRSWWQPQRRLILALALATVVIAAGTALAVRVLIGEPAPPQVKQQIARDFVPSKGLLPQMSELGSGVIAAKTFAAGFLQTSTGPVYLWAAPTRSGGYCTMLDIVAEEVHGKPTGSAFCELVTRGENFAAEFQGVAERGGPVHGGYFHKRLFRLLYGYAGSRIGTVTVQIGNRQAKPVPVHDHFFLIEIPADGEIVVTARNSHGKTVATRRTTHPSYQNALPPRFIPVRTLMQTRTFDRTIKLILGQKAILKIGNSGVKTQCTELVTPSIQWGCQALPKPAEIDITPVQHGGGPHALLLLWGRVGSRIASLQLRFQDGTTIALPLTDHYTLYAVRPTNFRPGHQANILIGRNSKGKVIARLAVRE